MPTDSATGDLNLSDLTKLSDRNKLLGQAMAGVVLLADGGLSPSGVESVRHRTLTQILEAMDEEKRGG